MSNLNISFAGHELSQDHTPDRWKNRTFQIMRVGDRFRLMCIDGGRYLLFYGEAAAKGPSDVTPPESFTNELTEAEADEGRTRTIDGKEYVVVGYGGTARTTAQRSDVEVLTTREPASHEVTVPTPIGPATVRKIGNKYQVFVVIEHSVRFFAVADVGPGFPTATIKNQLTLKDLRSTKVIDGKQYTVYGHGGEVKIEPQWFEGAGKPG